MPNRMIKETLRTSRNVSSLSDFQFRVWICLITYVDDYGRGSADPELLRSVLFPRRHGITDKQISDAIGTLASKGMVSLYESDGEPYFYFPKWGEHQRVRTKLSKFPAPPAENSVIRQAAASCGNPPQAAAECGQKPNQTNIETKPKEKCETNAHTREAQTFVRNPLITDEGNDGFETFWAAYPRKTGDIRQAYLAYVHALDIGAVPEQIMDALSWQAEEWREEGQAQFIPSPERWLTNRRWEEQRRKKKQPKGLAAELDPVGAVDLSGLENVLNNI